MASTDPHGGLELLAEKQMKSVMHAKYIERCIVGDVVPKGLQLKLTVSVGKDGEQLQRSVNELLHKTSLEICDRIRSFHLRRAEAFEEEIVEKRKSLSKKLSSNEICRIDSELFDKINGKKDVLQTKHNKKLAALVKSSHADVSPPQSPHADEPVTSAETETWTVVSKKRNYNRQNRRTKKGKTNVQQQDKQTVLKHTVTTRTDPTKTVAKKTNLSTQTAEIYSKNEVTPGTNNQKTYLEAATTGVVSRGEFAALIQTVTTLTQTVNKLLMKPSPAPAKNRGTGVLFGVQARQPGEKPNADSTKFKKGKKVF